MKASRLMKLLILLTAVAMLLAACPAPMPASDSGSGAADTGDSMAGDFKVGLVTDVGRVNDRSFNQSAWEGVVAAAEADRKSVV